MEIEKAKPGRKKKDAPEDAHNKPLAKNLRDLLEERELRQSDLAQAIGASRQSVGKWCSGETIPDIIVASKIASYFKVSLDYLVRDNQADDINIDKISDYIGLDKETSENLQNISDPKPSDYIEYEERSQKCVIAFKKLLGLESFSDFVCFLADLEYVSNSYLRQYGALYPEVLTCLSRKFDVDEKIIEKYYLDKLNEGSNNILLTSSNELDNAQTTLTFIRMRLSNISYSIMREFDNLFGLDAKNNSQLLDLFKLTRDDIKNIKGAEDVKNGSNN